jgi:hypothetical protein
MGCLGEAAPDHPPHLRGGLLDGMLYGLLPVRPLGRSWGVRGRQYRLFPVDFLGILLAGIALESSNRLTILKICLNRAGALDGAIPRALGDWLDKKDDPTLTIPGADPGGSGSLVWPFLDWVVLMAGF